MLADYEKRLKEALNPSELRLIDDSPLHQGHEGAQHAGPISHLCIEIEAESLKGLTLVQQHQKIYSLFKAELESGAIHALRIKVL